MGRRESSQPATAGTDRSGRPGRAAVVAGRAEGLLVALVVVIGAVGIAAPSPARSLDVAGMVNPTLAVLVLTAGLTVDTAALPRVRQHGRRLVAVLVTTSVALPALAWMLGHLVSGPAQGGILAAGVAPSEVASLGLASIAGGDAALAAGLLIGSSIVAVVVSGPILALLSGAPGAHPGDLLATLGLVVGLPLVAGVSLRRLLVPARPVLLDWGRIVGTAALLVLLWEVAGEVQVQASYLAVVGALVGYLAGAGMLGWLLSRGLDERAGPAVLLPVAMRDFAVAAGIAATAFGPASVGPLGIYGLLVLLAGAIAARRAAHLAGPRDPTGARR